MLTSDNAVPLLSLPRHGSARWWLTRIAAGLQGGARAIAGMAIVAELFVVLADVVSRSLLHTSLLWADEAAKLALSVIAFVGGAVAYRDDRHTPVQAIARLLSPGRQAVLAVGVEWVVLLVSGGCALATIALLQAHANDVTPMLQISVDWYVAPLIAGLVLAAVFAAERLAVRHAAVIVLPVGAVLLAVMAVLAWASPIPLMAANEGLALGAMLGLFFAAVLLGVPVAFAMLLATLAYLMATDSAPAVAVPQTMLDGTSNFILLALPFFILAGLIMEKGGISWRLVRFAMALVGRLRGGLLQVIVVTVFMISGISGSKVADVVAVGSVMRDELRRRGYRSEDGASVLAASAAMAETIPPSIAMLVLGSVTPISVGALFVAGLVPALVIALCLMTLIFVLARRRATPDLGPVEPVRWGSTLAGAVLPLLLPVAMLVGIKWGIATPTEVSSFGVIYGVVLAVMLYREMSPAALVRCIGAGVSMAGMVLFVLAAAAAFAWVLSAAGLPEELLKTLHRVGDRPELFMLGSIVLLIVVGSLLEGLPAITILAPPLLPIATQMGIDPVQYGIVLILAMGVGAFMPPIGIGFFVSAAVAESRFDSAARAMLPYLATLVAAVVLVALVPQITLALPNLVGR